MNKYKNLRINADISRKDAATKLNISIFYLRNIETGQRTPGRDVLIRMGELYKCSVDEILKAI
jgi:transcriptional regulator with XRE-family HTH domain